jgi:hypothetical protein
LLVRGYASGGYSGDTPEKCIKECEGLPLVAKDLSEEGFERAANDLINSDNFQRLYLSETGKADSVKMILAQAQLVGGLK